MERDHEEQPRYVPLPGFDEPSPGDTQPARRAAAIRDGGVRRARRASNWTAAALVAGVAATAGYFAHATHAVTPTAGTTAGTVAAGAAHQKACPAAPVATSGGSGVTVASPVGGSGNCVSTGGARGAAVAPSWSEGRDN